MNAQFGVRGRPPTHSLWANVQPRTPRGESEFAACRLGLLNGRRKNKESSALTAGRKTKGRRRKRRTQKCLCIFASKKRMDRFVSTFTNKVDAKGRVSVPAAFRDVLSRDGYSSSEGGGIYCYPTLDRPALDAGGERLAHKIDALLDGLSDYSDARDELSVALYGDVQVLKIDGDGRIVLPDALKTHAGIRSEVAFVGLGQKFQMWDPERFEEYRGKAREKVREHRKLLGKSSPDD